MANKSNLCLFILILLVATISCTTNSNAREGRKNDFGNYFRNARFGVHQDENKLKKLQPYLAKRRAEEKAKQNANSQSKDGVIQVGSIFRDSIDVATCPAKLQVESFFPLSGEPIQLTNEVKQRPKVAKGRFLGIGNKFVPRKDGVIKALRYYPTPKNQNQVERPSFSDTGLIRSLSTVVFDERGRIFSGGDFYDVNQPGWIYAPLYEPVAVRAGQTWYPTTTIHAGDEYYQREHATLDNQNSLTAPKGVSVRYDRVESIKTNDNQNFLDVLFTPHQTLFPKKSAPTGATDVAPLRFLQTNFEYVNTFTPKVDGKIYGIRYYRMPGDITPQHLAHFVNIEAIGPIPFKKGQLDPCEAKKTTRGEVPIESPNVGLDFIITAVSEILGGYKFDESSNEEGWKTYYLPYGVAVSAGQDFSVSVNFRVETLDGVVPGINFPCNQRPQNDFLEFSSSGFGLFGLKFVQSYETAYLIDVLFNPAAECLGEAYDNSFGLSLIEGVGKEMLTQFDTLDDLIGVIGGLPIESPLPIGNQVQKATPGNDVIGIPDTKPYDFSSCRNDRTIETLFGYDSINVYSRGKSERKVRERTAAQSIQVGNAFLPKRSGVIKAFKFYRPEGDSSHVPNVRDRFFSFYFHTLKVGVPVALITGETREGWQYLPAGVVVEKGFLLDFTYDVYKKSKYLEIKDHESKRRSNSLSLAAGVQGERTFIQLVEDILDHPVEFVTDLVGGGAVVGSSLTSYLYDFYPNKTRENSRFPLDALFVPFQGVFDFEEQEQRSRDYRRPQIKFDNSKPNVESGNVVSFSEYGYVYGVSFYKKQNDGTKRLVKIWELEETGDGKKYEVHPIETQPAFFESQTGWQDSIYFSEPVPVVPTKKYVISVNYGSNVAYVDHQQLPIVNGHVTLEASVVGDADEYPTNPTRGVNLVDVLFLVNNECLGQQCLSKKSA